MRGFGHPLNLAFGFLWWSDDEGDGVARNPVVERRAQPFELAIETDSRLGPVEIDAAAIDDDLLELGEFFGFLGSARASGERDREEPGFLAAADDHEMETPLAIFYATAEGGDLELPLPDTDENHRATKALFLALDLDRDSEGSQLSQRSHERDRAGEGVAETLLEALAITNEGHIGTDRAGVEKDAIVDVADVGADD